MQKIIRFLAHWQWFFQFMPVNAANSRRTARFFVIIYTFIIYSRAWCVGSLFSYIETNLIEPSAPAVRYVTRYVADDDVRSTKSSMPSGGTSCRRAVTPIAPKAAASFSCSDLGKRQDTLVSPRISPLLWLQQCLTPTLVVTQSSSVGGIPGMRDASSRLCQLFS